MLLAGILNQAVDQGVVEFAFEPFEHRPGNRCEHGVQMRRRQPGPDWLHVFETGGRVVAQLSRQVLFFQLPNHTKAIRRLCRRAS
jgi:hypothetical protein